MLSLFLVFSLIFLCLTHKFIVRAQVGLVAEMQEEQTELIIGGTVQQKIVSCLQVLDKLLRQDEPVVSSMVVAEKKATFIGANNIMDAVLNIIGKCRHTNQLQSRDD